MIFVGIRNIHIHVITHSGSVNIGSTMHLHAPTQDLPESILPSPDVPQPPQAPPLPLLRLLPPLQPFHNQHHQSFRKADFDRGYWLMNFQVIIGKYKMFWRVY